MSFATRSSHSSRPLRKVFSCPNTEALLFLSLLRCSLQRKRQRPRPRQDSLALSGPRALFRACAPSEFRAGCTGCTLSSLRSLPSHRKAALGGLLKRAPLSRLSGLATSRAKLCLRARSNTQRSLRPQRAEQSRAESGDEGVAELQLDSAVNPTLAT